MFGQVLAERYKVIAGLGQSDHSGMFVARDQCSQRVVAVKIPTDGFAVSPAWRDQVRAAQRQMSLPCPGLVRVSDVLDGNISSVVSERIEGVNLTRLAKDCSPADLACVCAQVVKTLALMQARGMQHGNLHASNVLISVTGEVLLSDPRNQESGDPRERHFPNACHDLLSWQELLLATLNAMAPHGKSTAALWNSVANWRPSLKAFAALDLRQKLLTAMRDDDPTASEESAVSHLGMKVVKIMASPHNGRTRHASDQVAHVNHSPVVAAPAESEEFADAQVLCSQLVALDTVPNRPRRDLAPRTRLQAPVVKTPSWDAEDDIAAFLNEQPAGTRDTRNASRQQTVTLPSSFVESMPRAADDAANKVAANGDSLAADPPRKSLMKLIADADAAVQRSHHSHRPTKSSHDYQPWVVASLVAIIAGCWLQGFCWGSPRTDTLDRQPIQGPIQGAAGRSGRLTLIPLKGTAGPAAFAQIHDGAFRFNRASGPIPGHYEAKILLETPSVTANSVKLPTGSAQPFLDPHPEGFDRERSVAVIVSAGVTQMSIGLQ